MGCTKEIFANRIAEIRNKKDDAYLRKRDLGLTLAAVIVYAVWLLI